MRGLLLFITSMSVPLSHPSSVDDELIESVFRDYNPKSRPVAHNTDNVNIYLFFGLEYVLDVVSKSQSIELSVFINMMWKDHRLTWDLNNTR